MEWQLIVIVCLMSLAVGFLFGTFTCTKSQRFVEWLRKN